MQLSEKFKKVSTLQWGIFIVVLLILSFYFFSSMKNTTDTTPVESAGNPVVIISTNLGDIELELYPDSSPVTVENFISYVNDGFYSGTVFHRVIDGFMVQGGGFMSDGQQKSTNEPIALESDNGLKNERGTIAMARTNAPDSATSQFFINLENNEFLNYSPQNPGYTVFGKVVSGMDVVDKIKIVKTGVKNGMSDWPMEDIMIEKVSIK